MCLFMKNINSYMKDFSLSNLKKFRDQGQKPEHGGEDICKHKFG